MFVFRSLVIYFSLSLFLYVSDIYFGSYLFVCFVR